MLPKAPPKKYFMTDCSCDQNTLDSVSAPALIDWPADSGSLVCAHARHELGGANLTGIWPAVCARDSV